MLTLNKKTEYALIALVHLCRNRDAQYSAREMSDMHKVSLPMLMNVLKILSQHNLVHSTRGVNGGYQLASDPNDITVDQLILLMEGPIKLVSCINGEDDHEDEPGEPCNRQGRCAIRSPLLQIHDRIRDVLAHFTLADLARAGRLPVATLRLQDDPHEPDLPG